MPMGKFQNIINTVMINIDFSETFSIPVKYESHSRVLTIDDEQSNHPFLSKYCKHDQQFVQTALEEMLLEDESIAAKTTTIIESDNCLSQYKSAAHFHGIQDL